MAISIVCNFLPFSCSSVDRPLKSALTPSRKAILLFNDTERQTAAEVVHRMVKRAVEMEGTVTGEHGVGLVKRDYLNHELGVEAVDAMRRVSSYFSSFALSVW